MRDFVEGQTLLHVAEPIIEFHYALARQVAAELNFDLRLPRVRPRQHPPGTPGRNRCSWPFTGAYISYDGKAMPCCMVATPDRLNFGDMAQKGVTAVWNSEPFESFRAALSSDSPPAICASCAVYSGTF
jgi:radical SAM protein with 4Fe4S-binding SPASM domain